MLYIFPNLSSFVEKDLAIFRKNYNVRFFQFSLRKKWMTPWFFLKELGFLLIHLTSAKVVVVQFGGYHSFLPVLLSRFFHKPSAIVMGGSDCVYFPSIGYGALGNPLLKWFTLKSLRWATVLLPASEALIEYEYTYQNSDYPKQGYKYFDPGNKTPVEVIYNGISTDVFSPVTGIKRDQFSFLTICVGLDRRNFFLKGIDLFFEAARLFPSCKFVLVGKTFPGFQFDKPENVVHVQYVPHCNLPELMSASQFYCQLSMSEGFGVALAESMSCGCVPIVSNVGIMDQIVGESGYVLKRHDIGLLKQIIEQSANDDLEEMSKMARGQIIKSYNDNQRSDRLLRTIGNLVKKC